MIKTEQLKSIDHVSLTYKGPEVEQGLIDISDVTDGLIGFQDCYSRIKEISKIEGESTLKLKGFKQGSFTADIISYLSENHIHLIGVGLGAGLGIPSFIYYLIKVKKHLKNKDAKSIEQSHDFILIENEEEEILKIKGNKNLIMKLLDDPKIAKSLWKITRPIKENEIDLFSMKIKNEKEEFEDSIDYKEKNWFEYSGKKEITTKREVLIGKIRSWDKKTGNGKFIYNKKGFSASFRMSNPEEYYHFFSSSDLVKIECEMEINESLEMERILIFDIQEIQNKMF